MIVKSYAKINLAINIKSKRDDGYHDLDMIMLPLELHDSIDISILPNIYDTYVTCDDFSLETGDYNLCTIAVKKMKEKYNFNKSFRIHIHKNIPIGAGLGGGSANAAAVIKGIKDLLKIEMTQEEELDICKSIGSDVPFCLYNKPARVEGIGDKLTEIEVKNKYYVIIIKPQKGLSTKMVYAKYDEVSSKSHANINKLIETLKNGVEEINKYYGNDLEDAAITLLPEIQEIKQVLKDNGLENVLMSGSGSSVFGISTDKKEIEKIAKKLDQKGFNVFLTKVLN